jgi:hypothetical protein
LTHDGVSAGTISFKKKIQEYNEDPDKKVVNPCTGEDFAANINMLVLVIMLLLSVSLTIKFVIAKSQHKAR